jgi:hypothetical protein
MQPLRHGDGLRPLLSVRLAALDLAVDALAIPCALQFLDQPSLSSCENTPMIWRMATRNSSSESVRSSPAAGQEAHAKTDQQCNACLSRAMPWHGAVSDFGHLHLRLQRLVCYSLLSPWGGSQWNCNPSSRVQNAVTAQPRPCPLMPVSTSTTVRDAATA